MPIGIVSDEDLLTELSASRKGKTRKIPSESILEREEIRREDSESVLESESEIERRPDNAQRQSPSVVDIIRPGRSVGDVNVPESLRKLIAEEALLNGRPAALSLAKDFGVSPSSASAYAVGSTSTTTYNNPSKSLISHIQKSRERAVKRASKTLNQALGSITQEKLDYADVKDLAGIAKDMSVIIKNLEPREQSDGSEATSQRPQFVIYAPQFKQESSFEVIHVKE